MAAAAYRISADLVGMPLTEADIESAAGPPRETLLQQELPGGSGGSHPRAPLMRSPSPSQVVQAEAFCTSSSSRVISPSPSHISCHGSGTGGKGLTLTFTPCSSAVASVTSLSTGSNRRLSVAPVADGSSSRYMVTSARPASQAVAPAAAAPPYVVGCDGSSGSLALAAGLPLTPHAGGGPPLAQAQARRRLPGPCVEVGDAEEDEPGPGVDVEQQQQDVLATHWCPPLQQQQQQLRAGSCVAHAHTGVKAGTGVKMMMMLGSDPGSDPWVNSNAGPTGAGVPRPEPAGGRWRWCCWGGA